MNDKMLTKGGCMDGITSANKRLKILVISLIIAAVVLAGAVVGVLAASFHSYGAEFSISYDVGDDIAAKVKVYYQIGDGEIVAVRGHNTITNAKYAIDSEGYTIFNVDDEAETLAPGQTKPSEPYYNITLNPFNPTITFYFHAVGMGEYIADGVQDDDDIHFYGILNGIVDSKFNCRYATKDGQQHTSLAGEWTDWTEGNNIEITNNTWYDSSEFFFKVELSVKETNSSFTADGINASFNLELTKA